MQQANIKQTVLLACLLVTVVVGGPPEHGHAVSYSSIDSPPVTFIGKDGDILRCSSDSACEIFHQVGSDVLSLLISGDNIYAGVRSGAILRCPVNMKLSCTTFYAASSPVLSLASGRGYLLAGLHDGTIQYCGFYRASCQMLHKVNQSVFALIQTNNNIYAALRNGQLMQCSLSKGSECLEVYKADFVIMGLASLRNSMYILTVNGYLSKCFDPAATDCVDLKVDIGIGTSWGMTAFNDSLYVQNYKMGVCKLVNDSSCETFINISSSTPWSMAMAYGSNDLRNQFKNEHVTCEHGAQNCQLVTYCNEAERAGFEVYVKEGRLYNSADYLVDTSDADQGHAGPAAIFVMAPDGKLYLSNFHLGATRTSSFLAGSPVSGAGEILVEKGVVRKILACSEHYEPTLELNAQVVQSLFTQGYTDAIVSETCPEIAKRDGNSHVAADLQDVKQGSDGITISEMCPESTAHKTYTAADVEDLNQKLQIIYAMQKSLNDLIKIYATGINALKENRINPKLDTCSSSDVTNGQ